MTGETYVCAKCGETCMDVSPDAEEKAVAEFEARFSRKFQRGKAEPICDDCYKKFLDWFLSQGR